MQNERFKICNKSVPGVYCIFNLTNDDRVYIGQSKNIQNRSIQHRQGLRSGIHHNKQLQEDYKKGDKFVVVAVEVFQPGIDTNSLLRAERNFIIAASEKYYVYNCDPETKNHEFWKRRKYEEDQKRKYAEQERKAAEEYYKRIAQEWREERENEKLRRQIEIDRERERKEIFDYLEKSRKQKVYYFG